MEPNAIEKKPDKFFDIEGNVTGVPVTKRLILTIPVAAILYFAISMCDLSAYGELASKGLGFFVATLAVLIMAPVSISVRTLFIVIGGFLLKIWDAAGITSTLGSSMFLQITGMMVLAVSIESTPLAKRVSFLILKQFGRRPVQMIIAVGIMSTVLSAFISNTAVIVIMGSILNNMLLAMGEKPGESKVGKAVMLVMLMGAMFGGTVLICGNPVGNSMSLQLMQTSSGYTVTFAQWAAYGVPCFIVCIIPFCLFYVWACKVKGANFNALPKEYYDEQLKSLGKFGGSEARWIIYVVLMVFLLLRGMSSSVAPLIVAFLSTLPVIGTGNAREIWRKMPFELLFSMSLIPIMGKLITTTGASKFLGSLLVPVLKGLPPLVFSMVVALIAGIAVNFLVNAASAVGPMFLAIVPPICVGLGYNPAVVMLPMIFVATFFFVMGQQTFMLINAPYGWWKTNEPMLPGILCVITGSIVFPLIVFALCGLVGMPVYI